MTSNFPRRERTRTLVRPSLYNLIFQRLSFSYWFYVLSHIKIRISVTNDFRVLVVQAAVKRKAEKRTPWSKDNIKIYFRQIRQAISSVSFRICIWSRFNFGVKVWTLDLACKEGQYCGAFFLMQNEEICVKN
jgi:hypothetical protein